MKDGNRWGSHTFPLSRRYIVSDTNQSKDLLEKNKKQPPSRTCVTSHVCDLHEHTHLANELLRLPADSPQHSACLFKVTWMNQTVFTCRLKPFLISLLPLCRCEHPWDPPWRPLPRFNPNIRANSEQEARARRQIKQHEQHLQASPAAPAACRRFSSFSSTSNTQILLGSGGERWETQQISLNYY